MKGPEKDIMVAYIRDKFALNKNKKKEKITIFFFSRDTIR